MHAEPSLVAIILYCLWTLLLLGGIAVLRGTLTATGRRKANSFAVDGSDVSPFSYRLCGAHANCFENLPIVLGVILSARLLGHSDITDGTAFMLVAARMAQSTTHLVSTSVRAVELRFLFFLLQYGILAYWIARLLMCLLTD